jgi:hypothetical protein
MKFKNLEMKAGTAQNYRNGKKYRKCAHGEN